jgi:alkylation response protein AidB-like acyl-CoA dehydrogenase
MNDVQTNGSHARESRFDLARFDRGFAEFLARVSAGAVAREADRHLLYDEVAELQALGFGALRFPADQGGGGLTVEELFSRLIDLSAADSSLGHLYRGHIAFVEGLLFDERESGRDISAWIERIVAGDLVGNAQSERQETATITTRLDRGADAISVTGTKYYTTGSIYADWIHLAALDGDDRVAVTVSVHDGGVAITDDWDGFGQLLTGSGTTVFDGAPVDPANIATAPLAPAALCQTGSILQLSLLAVVAGIAQAALVDTVSFVRPRRRTFGFAGETLPRDDSLVHAVVGELGSVAHTARALVLDAARQLDAVAAGTRDAHSVLLDVFRVQQVLPPLVLGVLGRLFEVGGASAVSRTIALDRHWRNVRTIASHNPAVQRAAALGQFELNGTMPEWSAPGAARSSETGATS